VTTVCNRQLLGDAGVTAPLVEVLRIHLRAAAVMENACRALAFVAADGEWREDEKRA